MEAYNHDQSASKHTSPINRLFTEYKYSVGSFDAFVTLIKHYWLTFYHLPVSCCFLFFFLHSRRQRIFGWKGRLLNRSHLTNITVMMAMVRMKYRKVQMKGGNGGCWMSSIEANQGLIGLSSWIDLINNNNIPIQKSQTASNTTYLKIFPGH